MYEPDKRRGETHINVTLDDGLTPGEYVRLQRLARELRMTNQILSVDVDILAVEKEGPAPAWTSLSGDKVSFNWKKMPMPYGPLDIAVWLGTNAHELGHGLFSPREGSTLMFRVIESDRSFLSGIMAMHNIVEDQREERLLLALFRPWTAYLTAALSHHLVMDDKNAWLLMCGRTWLPADIRQAAKARMIATRSKYDTDLVTALVGEYQKLTDPGESDVDDAFAILEKLLAIFDDGPPVTGGCGGGVIRIGEPNIDVDPTQGPPSADEADAEPSNGPNTGPGKGEGEGEAEGDDEGQEGEGKGEAPVPTTGAGDEPGTKPMKAKDVKELLRKGAKAQIESNAKTKDDLGSVLDALDYGRGGGEEAEGERPVGTWAAADDQARRLREDVGRALLDIKDEAEPGWLKRTESGRLNVRRIGETTDPSVWFDRYQPGMLDATEMEVVLLIDVSGSMAGQLKALGRACWAIRHAVDGLEGSCTVITYESGPHRLLANPGERPDDRMFIPSAMGGTQPKSALLESMRVLAGSPAMNRLLIILTDGSWFGGYGSSNADSIIAGMRGLGVTTVMALLGEHAGDNGHNCEFVAHIDEGEQLALLFRRVAAERIRSHW